MEGSDGKRRGYMAVSNEIIINKMMHELEEANRKAHQQDQVKKTYGEYPFIK